MTTFRERLDASEAIAEPMRIVIDLEPKDYAVLEVLGETSGNTPQEKARSTLLRVLRLMRNQIMILEGAMIKPTDLINLDTPVGEEIQKQLKDLLRMMVMMELDADKENHSRQTWWYFSEMLQHTIYMIDAEVGARSLYNQQQKMNRTE